LLVADPGGVPLNIPVFNCRRCHSTQPARIEEKVSTGGIVVFAILLIACFPLCWIGLLIKDPHSICTACGFDHG
jgi:hypothetical protein